MPSPSNTARTCLALGRHRNRVSLPATTSATDDAASAPSAFSRASRSGARSKAITRAPLFLTRLRQIGSPITPRPIKPMVLWCGICTPAGLFDERARGLQVQGKCIDLVAGARIDRGDFRIVARDDAIGMTSQPLDGFPALAHVADVIDDRKWAAAMQIAVEMRGI